MSKKLIRRVSLYSCFLLAFFPTSKFYSMDFGKLNKLYTFCYIKSKPLSIRRLKKIETGIKDNQLSSRLVWSRMMIQTLYAISLSKRKEALAEVVDTEINQMVLLYKQILKGVKSRSRQHEKFFSGEFAFDLALLRHQYKFKVSRSSLLIYSSDMFRLVIFEDPKGELAKRARVMLAIIKSYSADMSTDQWNSYILEQLSDYTIDALTNKRLRYQAYLYRSLFCRKIGNPKEANRSLRIAETIFPKGRLVERLENRWKSKKEGPYVVR